MSEGRKRVGVNEIEERGVQPVLDDDNNPAGVGMFIVTGIACKPQSTILESWTN